jgi:hypothetical protein
MPPDHDEDHHDDHGWKNRSQQSITDLSNDPHHLVVVAYTVHLSTVHLFTSLRTPLLPIRLRPIYRTLFSPHNNKNVRYPNKPQQRQR